MSRRNINNTIGNYFQQNPNSNISNTLDFMRNSGINRTDIQSFGGYNNYGPQMSMPQTQQPFNPYTNSSVYGGGFSNTMSNIGNLLRQTPTQMQSPFSFQQPSYQPQMQMQTPFSFQQPSYQPSYQQQYNPYQMQSPFSYQQQPSYGGMGRNNFIPDAPLPEGMMGTMGGTGYDPMTGRMDLGTAGGSGQYTPAPPRSSGPSQAIVGRSSQMRGTPNVMRRAEGGITSLMDDVE
jgi:hypothetical protein